MVTAPPLRIVFFGTPQFAVPTLEALLRTRHTVASVVSQPDRPSGRGQRTTATPTKTVALAAQRPVLQPLKMRDPIFLEALRSTQPDLGVVAAYGKILTDEVLAVPRLGMVNVHASLLPRYRGAAPIHRAVMAGEVTTGITIMKVIRELDAGPMLAIADRAIGPNETSEEVERDLARLGASLLVATVEEIAEGRAVERPQDDSRATYADRITKEDGRVDWRWPAERVHNLIRGLHPWPHASTHLGSDRLILLRSTWSLGRVDAAPGTILEASGDRLDVATGSGVIHVIEIQPEGKRPMNVRQFLAGRRLAPGSRFSS